MNRAHLFIMALLCVITVMLFARPVHAAGKPLSISLSPSVQTVTEGQSASFLLSKSGGNGRPSLVRIATSDGSFSGSAYPGTTITIPTKDDTTINPRDVTLIAVASTGAKASAVIHVLDNDTAPPTPSAQWVSAPLSDASGYVRTKTACPAWNPYARPVVAGEVLKISTSTAPPLTKPLSNISWDQNAKPMIALTALSDGATLYLYTDCLEGVTPAAGYTPPL